MTYVATMIFDRISTTTTCEMLHEECLWNVIVFQRVQLSNLVRTGFSPKPKYKRLKLRKTKDQRLILLYNCSLNALLRD
jgi:hypothetical protein